jgi:hypothetical protein
VTQTAEAPELTPVQQLAVRRWKGGHHAFHVLLVAMNTRLDQASDLLDHGEYDRAAPLLDELAGLYRAATALMRYASDFRAADYETLVRPSMMPPFASPGFSGLANQDHAIMLDRMARLRAAVSRDEDASERVKAAGGRLVAAQKDNRASHMLVCRRFVPEGQSLLREFFRQRREEGLIT